MRVENSMKNAKYNLIFYFISIILNFVSRSFFIRFLGVDILGIQSIIINLIGFLSIAELGIGMAITYSLYKPLSSKDYKKLSDIMSLFKYYYKRISLIILVAGMILSLFLKFFVKGQYNLGSVYIFFYLYLINTVITYMFSYRQTLIIADQKQYIVTFSTNIIKIIQVTVQIIILLVFHSFALWIIAAILFNSLNLTILNKKCASTFTQIDFKGKTDIKRIKKENSSIIKDIKNVFMHKIAEFIIFQTDGLVISFFLNLKDTGIYSNYVLIINSCVNLFTTLMGSLSASIGDLISTGDHEKSFDIFKKSFLIENISALIVSFTLYHIINLFMDVWLGANLTFSKPIVFVLMLNVYIQISRNTVDRFISGYGLFWDIYAPVIEGAINLILSVILIQKYGVVGVLIGTLVSNIVIILIWKPYFLFKYGFKMNIFKYISVYLKCIISGVIAVLIANFIINLLTISTVGFLGFIINSIIVGIIISIIGLILYFLQKDFRNLAKYVLRIIR